MSSHIRNCFGCPSHFVFVFVLFLSPIDLFTYNSPYITVLFFSHFCFYHCSPIFLSFHSISCFPYACFLLLLCLLLSSSFDVLVGQSVRAYSSWNPLYSPFSFSFYFFCVVSRHVFLLLWFFFFLSFSFVLSHFLLCTSSFSSFYLPLLFCISLLPMVVFASSPSDVLCVSIFVSDFGSGPVSVRRPSSLHCPSASLSLALATDPSASASASPPPGHPSLLLSLSG